MLRELSTRIQSAKDEARIRPEHFGYDLMIDSSQVVPLIKELEESTESLTESEKREFERLIAERKRLLARPRR